MLNFTLTQLEYVLAVHHYGHFAKAAEACHITQPTLSMQIQKLEEDLAVIIFDRSKKPILLTAEGKALIEQMKKALQEARKIGQVLAQFKEQGIQGQLRVGIIPTITPYLLPLLLGSMEKLYPELRLELHELQTKKILEALEKDEIDVGILATGLKHNSFYEIALYYEPFHLICHRDHELALKKKAQLSELRRDDLWLLEEGHCLRNQILDICSLKKGNKKQFQFESGNLETLKNLVALYGGFTLLPHLAAKDLEKKILIRHFERPIPSREVGLIYTREHYKANLIEALAEAIIDSLPTEIKNLRKKDLDLLPIDEK